MGRVEAGGSEISLLVLTSGKEVSRRNVEF